MLRRVLTLSFLLALTVLPAHVPSAHAGSLQVSVQGVPLFVRSVDVADIEVRGIDLGADFNPAAQLGQFYEVARIAMRNVGDVPFAYSPSDFTLLDTFTGVIHQVDSTDPSITATRLTSGILAPGATVFGDLSFLVNNGEFFFTLFWKHAPSAVVIDP